MNTISFITANYVARELGYSMTGGWGQGDRATQEYFRPVETFPERFDALLAEIAGLGFRAIDLWTGHLNPSWASAEHLAVARDLLAKYSFPVVSLAGWFGSTPEELEATCRIAETLGCRVLGGSTSMLEKDRAYTVAALKTYGLVLALENHPEKNPAALLAKIGDAGDGTIGACVDTGWFGTQGYDAARALEELRDVLVHVHLKDVRAAGAHDTCAYGEGVVPIAECVAALRRLGYTGAIGVEHEPEHGSPNAEAVASRELLERLLAA